MRRLVTWAVLMVAGTAGLLVASGRAEAQTLPADRVTVVMTELEPFVSNDEGRAKGFYAEIWSEVAFELGIEFDVLWVESFGELLPAIDEGRADIAVAPLAPTAERENMYDFTSAVVSSGPQLGFTAELAGRPSILRSLFDSRVLRLIGTAIAGLLLAAHVIWLFERNRHHEDGDFHPHYLRGIWDGFWWSTVTATTVGYGDISPKSFGGRLVALILMLSSLILVGAFVSQVTSIMAQDFDGPPISSLDDVDGSVGVVGGTSFAQYIEDQGVATREFGTQREVFEAAEAGLVDVIVTNPFALQALGDKYGVEAVEGVLYEEFETFGLAQGSPWREPINQALADLQASGDVAEIIKDGLN